LRDGAVDDLAARDRFLASIERQTDRLIRLVNDLLMLSRADAQALILRREQADLLDIARAGADELAWQAEAQGIEIVVAGGPAPACIDADRIRQVLINLLDNALHYSPPGGSIRVSVALAPGRATIAVADSGPGIPAADRLHVFERFYRGDRSRQRGDATTTGSGLGLAIAKTLVEAHGGGITLESRDGPADHGTTVAFWLPVD
jgi:two-component system OmpR family sensor kinase